MLQHVPTNKLLLLLQITGENLVGEAWHPDGTRMAKVRLLTPKRYAKVM